MANPIVEVILGTRLLSIRACSSFSPRLDMSSKIISEVIFNSNHYLIISYQRGVEDITSIYKPAHDKGDTHECALINNLPKSLQNQL